MLRPSRFAADILLTVVLGSLVIGYLYSLPHIGTKALRFGFSESVASKQVSASAWPGPAPGLLRVSDGVMPEARAGRVDDEQLLTAVKPTSATTLQIPVQGIDAGELLDTFTARRNDGRTHNAIDILAPEGTPVLATTDGRIAKLFESDAGGLTIYQYDTDGKYAYYYAHLDDYADELREGMAVRQGQLIGYVGSSGNADSDTPHLHFAIFRLGPAKRWWKGTPINPYPLLLNTAADHGKMQ